MMSETIVRKKRKTSVYFKNLNSLRFIAVLMVFVHHAEQIKDIYASRLKHYDYEWLHALGTLGVRLFFVLSGFLITYLLFAEQETSGTISIKNFYIRRALRIWPLYYLIILLSMFVLPQFPVLYPTGFTGYSLGDMGKTLAPYLFFLSNIVMYTYGVVGFASHTWSIGTEEQFYLVWPVLFKKFRNKLVVLVSIIVLYIVLKHVFAHLPAGRASSMLVFYWAQFPIDNMAIGGLFALILYSRSAVYDKIRKVIFNPVVQVLAYVAIVASVGFSLRIPDLVFEYYCILFGIVIVNLAANERSVISMETPVLKYLGKISYGLYIYHPLATVMVLKGLERAGMANNVLFYVLAMGATILISALSYELFEQRFIVRKKKFSVVVSGDNSAAGRD